AENCHQHVAIEAEFCLFARLCHPQLNEIARREVAEADVFIVSANSRYLPTFVRQWINDFVSPKTSVVYVALQPE
ncbi:MAG TPA: hypothetical protein VL970_06870, partial [Candidatus Acidoferrales bacterium]|nr:hypothetical protein [Candidatus Acidoferrales bacterium]